MIKDSRIRKKLERKEKEVILKKIDVIEIIHY